MQAHRTLPLHPTTLPTAEYRLDGFSVLVNPKAVTCFTRDAFHLELFALFAIAVAAKNADQQSLKLAQFLMKEPRAISPFDAIRRMIEKGTLRANLEAVKMGQYEKRLEPAFRAIVNKNLTKVTWQELMQVQGVGQKTAKFFVIHSRPAQRICALDAMILLYAAEKGYESCPLVTPGNEATYQKIEQFVLDCFDAQAEAEGLSQEERYAVLDLRTWEHYRELSRTDRKNKRTAVKG